MRRKRGTFTTKYEKDLWREYLRGTIFDHFLPYPSDIEVVFRKKKKTLDGKVNGLLWEPSGGKERSPSIYPVDL